MDILKLRRNIMGMYQIFYVFRNVKQSYYYVIRGNKEDCINLNIINYTLLTYLIKKIV